MTRSRDLLAYTRADGSHQTKSVSPPSTYVDSNISPFDLSSDQSLSHRRAPPPDVASTERYKALPAITIEDPKKTVTLKRARNTMAARKFQAKKSERAEELEKSGRKFGGRGRALEEHGAEHGTTKWGLPRCGYRVSSESR